MDWITNKVRVLYILQIYINITFSIEIDDIETPGVILERLHDVSFTNGSWTFVLNYDMEQLREDSQRLKIILNKLELVNQPIASTYQSFGLDLQEVYSSIMDYIQQAEELLDFLPAKNASKTHKRVIDEVRKQLFDSFNSTKYDIEKIQYKIKKLKSYIEPDESTIISKIHERMTFMVPMEKTINSNSQKLITVTTAFLNFSTEQVDELKKQRMLFLNKLIDGTYANSDITKYFQKMNFALSQAKSELAKLKAAIYSSANSRLDPALIPQRKMESLLKWLKEKLEYYAKTDNDPHLPLTFPKFQSLYKFSLASVSTFTSPSDFIFFVSIPVIPPDSSLKVYLPHLYPVYDTRTHLWLELDLEPSVLLLSHDHLYYSVLPISAYRSCINDSLNICFKDMNVTSIEVPHCLLDIYNNSTRLCNYIVKVPSIIPYILRIQDSVIFSTNSKVTLTASCADKRNFQMTVDGHGMIRNSSDCAIFPLHEKYSSSLFEETLNFNLSPEINTPTFEWSSRPIENSSQALTLNINSNNNIHYHIHSESVQNDKLIALSSIISAANDVSFDETQFVSFAIIIIGSTIGVAIIVMFILFGTHKYRTKYHVVNQGCKIT